MTAARTTPNPGTTKHPERSSTRVAHKKPLGWLPWALLAAIAALVALTFLVINAIDDDGRDGPSGDSLGQVSGADGSGLDGADGNGEIAGAEGESEADGAEDESAGADSSGDPAPSAAPPGGQTAGLAGLNAAALVGGAGIAPAPASAVAATDANRAPGTAGTVLFVSSSAELDANAQQVVATAVEGLRGSGARAVEVRGYTDVVAGQQVNDPLSMQRAEAVAGALRSQLPGVSVTTASLGQNDPVATNDTEEGRQQNRRAAIVATS